MERRGRLRPVVWYTSTARRHDPEVGRKVGWGELPSIASEEVPAAEVAARIDALPEAPDAVLTAGWTASITWSARAAAARRGAAVILPGDKTLNERTRREPTRTASALAHAAKNRLFDGFLVTGILARQFCASTGVPEDRIARGLYPVDVAWWQARMKALGERSAELRRWAGDGATVVVAVTKLSEREDPLGLVRAFGRMHRKVPKARFLLVGDGPMREATRSTAGAQRWGAALRMEGYVPYQELPLYYGAADIFVHAPKVEPWGLSVLEAMACGVPVVATTAVGSAADLVITGRTGWVAEPDDPDRLGGALASLAAAIRRRPFHEEVTERVRAFDLDSASEELEHLVERCCYKGMPADWPSVAAVARRSVRNEWGAWPP
ncbi:MAG: glycosyltransferase [Pseudomonadota bacterium]|nr:glycosyltransferase [Pseudomonadota bacterium]